MSTRGPARKKDSQRTRRTVTPGAELARGEAEVRVVPAGGAAMPDAVASDPQLAEIWLSLAGDGSTFRPEEALGLELMTYWLRVARECYGCVDPGDGGPLMLMDESESGDLVDSKYMKLMDTATKNYM